MRDTPSRSEIESALTGKQRLHKRKVPSSYRPEDGDIDFDMESQSPRRQQVIGGDLTGVSRRRQKKSIISYLSQIHITNWIAVIIVVCILIAFFWPHNSTESIREVVEKNIETQTKDFYTESRVDEPLNSQDTLSFSRTDDVDRASQYRDEEENQTQLDELLSAAKENMAKGQYISPAANNAFLAYQNILKLEAGNTDAIDGINNLKTRFYSSGTAALKDNNEKAAVSALQQLSSINAESAEYKRLSTEIKNWRIKAEIDDLIAKAETAKQNDKLILPANTSSLSLYKQVLTLDSKNKDAKAGIEGIADVFIDRANTALLRGDLDAATGYLATASVVDAEHQSIELIREMITNAEPIAAQISNATPQTVIQTLPETQPASPTLETLPSVETTQTNSNRQVSDSKTPSEQANEQEQFDQVYLNQGLSAYYKGDYDIAASLLQPLADKGISRAQFRMGYMYYLGRGVAQNRSEADTVLRAALPAIQKFANEGRSWAQSDLGSLYEDGLVLPRNYSEAVFWYRSAAEQGYAGAQTNLGIMYARGRGVTQSRQTAIAWFQRAAKQGDIAAQRNLESFGVN